MDGIYCEWKDFELKTRIYKNRGLFYINNNSEYSL